MCPTSAWTDLKTTQAALFASLRTFAHAERFFHAVSAALEDRACVESGRLYVRMNEAIVPVPLLELTRIQILGAPPEGMTVRFRATVVGPDGTVQPATFAEAPPEPPPLDLAPRGASVTAGRLVLAEGLATMTASYDGRGVLDQRADPAETPLDVWIARVLAVDPGSATTYRLHRASGDQIPVATAFAQGIAGLKRALGEGLALAPFIAIDCAEGKAIGRGDSADHALSALRDDLFRARPRRADRGLVTPATLTALVVAVPATRPISRRLLDAGFGQVRVAVGHVDGLSRAFVRDEAGGLTAIGEGIADRIDPAMLDTQIERVLGSQQELVTAHARSVGDDDTVDLLAGAAVHTIAVRDDGTLHGANSSYGSSDAWSIDGDRLARSVIRVRGSTT